MNFALSPAARYCLHILRLEDFDRYIACLFAPPPERAALAAIWALDCEMAKIVRRIRNPLIGEMRLRWWCDEIEKIAIAASQNHHEAQTPLLLALTHAIEQFTLPKQSFIAAAEARMRMLYVEDILHSPEFDHYCHETSGIFFQLACHILDHLPQTKAITSACFHASQAETLWRHLLWQTSHDKIVIPAIQHHYAACALQIRQLPRSLRPAFLPLVPVGAYLHQPEHVPKSIHRFYELSSLRRLWLIGRAALTGHF